MTLATLVMVLMVPLVVESTHSNVKRNPQISSEAQATSSLNILGAEDSTGFKPFGTNQNAKSTETTGDKLRRYGMYVLLALFAVSVLSYGKFKITAKKR